MNQRAYTLDEIDRMREMLWYLLRSRHGATGSELNETIERRLRTYLMAGIDPAEIEARLAAQNPQGSK